MEFAKIARHYGYRNATLLPIEDHPSVGLTPADGYVTDYPEDWVRYYFAKQYFAYDPVVRLSRRSVRPFFWSEAMDMLARDAGVPAEAKEIGGRLMREAGEAGLAEGIAIPMSTRFGERSIIGLSREETGEPQSVEDLATLGFLGSVFHERFFGFFEAESRVRVSPRETDVLSWSAEGKTDSEIATLLGVTTATVRFHWKNIFTKLNAVNKVNATAKAIRLGLVSVSGIKVPQLGKAS